jgi:hypothetical protein
LKNGAIAKLFTSVPGGLTIYQFDPTGTIRVITTRISIIMRTGWLRASTIRRGQIIGYVGSTGDADAARIRISILRFSASDRKSSGWKGDPLDPYPALTRR